MKKFLVIALLALSTSLFAQKIDVSAIQSNADAHFNNVFKVSLVGKDVVFTPDQPYDENRLEHDINVVYWSWIKYLVDAKIDQKSFTGYRLVIYGYGGTALVSDLLDYNKESVYYSNYWNLRHYFR